MNALRWSAAMVAVLALTLGGVATVTVASSGNSRALHRASSATNAPLRTFYSPDAALKQDVVSGYVTGPQFPWSARPGQTLQFHVGSYSPHYSVQMVRMFNANP